MRILVAECTRDLFEFGDVLSVGCDDLASAGPGSLVSKGFE